MNNLKQREYYKIFTGTNQEGGLDKIHLGYESDSVEITFKKDYHTYFHVPFFTQVQVLSNNNITGDGATPGPIPAMSDRIQQKLGGYGQNTPWGNPSGKRTFTGTPAVTSNSNPLNGFTDGTWLCSWLYSVSGESPQWFDRYYNPGRIAYKEALQGDANFDDYIINDPIFIDIPSTMLLEPGVWYQYFHNGEKSAAEIVNSFAGDDKSKLTLNIENWSPLPRDTSIYNTSIITQNFKSEWIVNDTTPGTIQKEVLSFKNTDFIDTRVVYSTAYNNPDEYTLTFWAQNDDWQNAPGTQLIGNYNDGGYGVFFNNLKYYPYFVVPETFYGHVFYFNSEGNNYLDKSTQVGSTDNVNTGTSSIVQVAINSNNETIVADAGNQKRIYKLNHIGDVIATTKNSVGTNYNITGIPKLIAIDGKDGCYLITTTDTYYFDKDLIFVSLSAGLGYQDNELIAFDTTGTLVREASCLDLKFDNTNQKWTVKTNGDLYCENVSLSGIVNNVTNIAIDPENNIWALYGTNKIYKINPVSKQIIDSFEIGVDVPSDIKNISFIYTYDRLADTKEWYALIYHSYEKTLYQVTLNGKIHKTTLIPTKLDIQISPPTIQDKNNLTFNGKGDFTGYEWKRIFHKVLYNNNPQIQFKQAVRRFNTGLPQSVQILSVPVNYLTSDTWHFITCTLQNRTMRIYIDSRLRDELVIPNSYIISNTRKNDLYIGTPCGKTTNLNKEINSTALIFDGLIDKIRFYNYAIKSSFLQIFVRELFLAEDLVWNIPTANLQYIEIVDRFFKHKLPGSKSQFFKIRLAGSQIADTATRQTIETTIRAAVEQIKPAYSELLSIEWIE